jgi:Concanavalin A-like lectin/glucanases superfamily
VLSHEWHLVAFTYDGVHAKSYLDGALDRREGLNPYRYEAGLFDGGEDGSPFTVGAVSRGGRMGNFYAGLLGGRAVFGRALTEDELAALYRATLAAESI